MNPEHIEAAADWQKHGYCYHRDAMALRDMISRRHRWDHGGFKTALEYCEYQAMQCYRQARWVMGLEEDER